MNSRAKNNQMLPEWCIIDNGSRKYWGSYRFKKSLNPCTFGSDRKWWILDQICIPDAAVLHQGSTPFSGSKLIVKCWAGGTKVKISLWLAFKHRHWAAHRSEWYRYSHRLETHTNCPLCDREAETCNMLATCSLTIQIWSKVMAVLGVTICR